MYYLHLHLRIRHRVRDVNEARHYEAKAKAEA